MFQWNLPSEKRPTPPTHRDVWPLLWTFHTLLCSNEPNAIRLNTINRQRCARNLSHPNIPNDNGIAPTGKCPDATAHPSASIHCRWHRRANYNRDSPSSSCCPAHNSSAMVRSTYCLWLCAHGLYSPVIADGRMPLGRALAIFLDLIIRTNKKIHSISCCLCNCRQSVGVAVSYWTDRVQSRRLINDFCMARTNVVEPCFRAKTFRHNFSIEIDGYGSHSYVSQSAMAVHMRSN